MVARIGPDVGERLRRRSGRGIASHLLASGLERLAQVRL
jgi:hypothetical protein